MKEVNEEEFGVQQLYDLCIGLTGDRIIIVELLRNLWEHRDRCVPTTGTSVGTHRDRCGNTPGQVWEHTGIGVWEHRDRCGNTPGQVWEHTGIDVRIDQESCRTTPEKFRKYNNGHDC